ncbi:MAG: hypothetical protein R8K20_07175 [Gallionellaceae bacterium]
MAFEFAPELENAWFDKAGALNRRPGQTTFDDGAAGGNTKTLFEHLALSGASTLFKWSDDTNIYALSGSTWASSLAGVFTSRPRTAQISGQTMVGDAVSNRYFNGAWNTPTGAQPMNMFTTYNGRMYGAGDPSQRATVYFSDTIGGTGVGIADWTTTGPGGILDISGAVDVGQTVTGLATFQGMLVVFCEHVIIFYSGSDPATPSTFSVQKVIRGIGCVSHDTIQGIGNDMIFLSQFGFKKLREVLVQGDAAAEDSSIPINNFIVGEIRLGNALTADLRSAFAPKFGVYLCRFGNRTVVYHVLFDSWTFWFGLEPNYMHANDGTLYLEGTRLHKLDDAVFSDAINGGTPVAIPMVWGMPPFRTSSKELKARWNRTEILYQGEVGDTVTMEIWPDLDITKAETFTVTLDPSVPVSDNTSMIWSGVASADPRRAWGGATTGPSWGGSITLFDGDERTPIRGISELLSIRLTNANISQFKISAFEIYFNEGGVR